MRTHEARRPRPLGCSGQGSAVMATRQSAHRATRPGPAPGARGAAPPAVVHTGPSDVWTIMLGASTGTVIGAATGIGLAAVGALGLLPAVLIGMLAGPCLGLLVLISWVACRHPDRNDSRRWST